MIRHRTHGDFEEQIHLNRYIAVENLWQSSHTIMQFTFSRETLLVIPGSTLVWRKGYEKRNIVTLCRPSVHGVSGTLKSTLSRKNAARILRYLMIDSMQIYLYLSYQAMVEEPSS